MSSLRPPSLRTYRVWSCAEPSIWTPAQFRVAPNFIRAVDPASGGL